MYIAFGNRVLDSKDIKNIIEENTEFKVIKDMSKGSKREDIVAFNLSVSIDILNEEIEESININELDEDSLFDEYMASTEELGFELEEYLPEDSIIDFKAYKWEPSDNDIKAVLVMANEELGYSCVTSHTYTPSPKQTQLFLSMYPSNSLIVYSFFIMWIKSGLIIIPTFSPTENLAVD